MTTFIYILFATAAIFFFTALTWRFASRRHSLPCPAWLHWFVEIDNPFTKTNRAESIIPTLSIKPGMAILDVGCGPGRLTIPLAQEVGHQGVVVAMDIQQKMLKRAQKKAKAANLNNIQFLHAGIGDGSLGRNKYDRAVLVTVLGEIPDRESAMKEIYCSLKPGGILSVTEMIFDPHYQRKTTVVHFAKKAGFKEKSFYGNNITYTLNFEKSDNQLSIHEQQ